MIIHKHNKEVDVTVRGPKIFDFNTLKVEYGGWTWRVYLHPDGIYTIANLKHETIFNLLLHLTVHELTEGNKNITHSGADPKVEMLVDDYALGEINTIHACTPVYQRPCKHLMVEVGEDGERYLNCELNDGMPEPSSYCVERYEPRVGKYR